MAVNGMLPPAPTSPELSLLNFQPLTYHHSHFLAANFDFTTFSPYSYFKGATIFFYSVDVLV